MGHGSRSGRRCGCLEGKQSHLILRIKVFIIERSAPEPNAGNQPNLSLVPAPAPPPRKPYALSKADERGIAVTQLLVSNAGLPTFAPSLAPFGINAAFLATLQSDLQTARQCSERALNCTNAKEGATASQAATKETLVESLRNIQSIARGAYEDSNPAKVKDYLTGENIAANRPVLEGAAQTIISKANADRPGGIDTDFINRVTAERTAYINSHGNQQTELGKGKQERALRKELIASIRERRKKIQRAADAAWPWPQPTSAEARVKFRLPAKRPYSY